jgi:hypothetical protein
MEKLLIRAFEDGFEIVGNRAGLKGLAQVCLQLADLPDSDEDARRLVSACGLVDTIDAKMRTVMRSAEGGACGRGCLHRRQVQPPLEGHRSTLFRQDFGIRRAVVTCNRLRLLVSSLTAIRTRKFEATPARDSSRRVHLARLIAVLE